MNFLNRFCRDFACLFLLCFVSFYLFLITYLALKLVVSFAVTPFLIALLLLLSLKDIITVLMISEKDICYKTDIHLNVY